VGRIELVTKLTQKRYKDATKGPDPDVGARDTGRNALGGWELRTARSLHLLFRGADAAEVRRQFRGGVPE